VRFDKVPFETDKRIWHPTPLVNQVALVTTLNEDGESNVSPKSWISMMAFEPPILALGCNLQHWTARNILRDREFVVNFPGDDLVDIVWRAHALPHPRPVAALGLTEIPSLRVRPPRVGECRGHLECALDRHVAYGDEVILLARLLAASVDRAALQVEDAYAYLRPLLFLEEGVYAVLEGSRRLAPAGE
jgi:flavin reductase (DIM6/NTAB) family NADH-FMN oxidoreductase RutF